MMLKLFTVSLLLLIIGTCTAQENEFIGLVKNLLQGDEFKTFQQTYAALPIEIRDKLSKDLLSNPGKLGKELLTMIGPQFQKLLNGFQGGFNNKEFHTYKDSENEIEGNENIAMDYSKDGQQKENKKKNAGGGFDFGNMAEMFGNLVSSNPQMLLTMAQSFLGGGNGGQGGGGALGGLDFNTISTMLTQNLDINTMINMAQSFGILGDTGSTAGSKNKRGEDDGKPGGGGATGGIGGMLEMFKINEMIKAWKDFITSPMGKKLNKIVPRVLKSQSLPDALRILEKETSFRFDIILRQLQDPQFRGVLVSQTTKPIGMFLKTITIPKDLKELMKKADEILNKKLGLGVKVKEYIEPIFLYIRDTFKISRESLMDLQAEDIEKIASELLLKEVLDPLSMVWDAYEKSRQNQHCAYFIFCQLNRNYYNENFIRRNVIRTASIISAFQVSPIMGKDAFSKLYEACNKGADGYDCTTNVKSMCLDLMHTAHHDEF